MNEKHVIVKDDILFLENPTWVVSKRDTASMLTFQTATGSYGMENASGLPARFDKIVLYYVLHKLFSRTQFKETTVHLTRYKIAKNVLNQDKNFSKGKYDRIMEALVKWQTTVIHIQTNNTQTHFNHPFTIIESITLDSLTNILSITFNAEYIEHLRASPSYQLINIKDYKNLARPVSARLYELLLCHFRQADVWNININELALLLTLEKKEYPSQIIVALKPAIAEINKYTQLKIRFSYDQQRESCIFKCVQITRMSESMYFDMLANATPS